MLVETKGADTLILESAISAVEVHFDDERWNQFSPIAMDITVTSYNSYADENVRILGEKRIVDAATGKTMFESMDIIKDEKIVLSGEFLEFENLKPALDKWIEHVKNYFAK
jgi:glutaredoxin 2